MIRFSWEGFTPKNKNDIAYVRRVMADAALHPIHRQHLEETLAAVEAEMENEDGK